jgi:hypothetical protein
MILGQGPQRLIAFDGALPACPGWPKLRSASGTWDRNHNWWNDEWSLPPLCNFGERGLPHIAIRPILGSPDSLLKATI